MSLQTTVLISVLQLTVAFENENKNTLAHLRTVSKCTKSREKPLVSIKNSTHVSVSWANAFEDACFQNMINITRIEVLIQGYNKDRKVEVGFPSTNEAIETELCMYQLYEIKLTYTLKGIEHEAWSSPAYYNIYPYRVENLYSGLLKEKVIDKICKKANGEYLIPSVPTEIQNCINKSLKIESASKLKVEIMNPNGPGTITRQYQLETTNCSSISPNEPSVQFVSSGVLGGLIVQFYSLPLCWRPSGSSSRGTEIGGG